MCIHPIIWMKQMCFCIFIWFSWEFWLKSDQFICKCCCCGWSWGCWSCCRWFVVVVIAGLVLLHLLHFLPCMSHVIFNLVLNYNPLILFYCAIYFLTLSIFILSCLLIVSSIHFFALPFLFHSGVIYQNVVILKYLLSQNSTHPRCLNLMTHYLYILPVLCFFDILGNNYEVYLGFLPSYFWNPRWAPMLCMPMQLCFLSLSRGIGSQ